MPRTSALSISYGGLTIGGSSPYRINGPHVFEIANERVRVTADVVVLANDQAQLAQRCQVLETAMRARQGSLGIALGSATWAFPSGSGLLNATASARKSGNPQIDRGVSRGYTITVEGELPAGDRRGLRSLSTSIDYTDARQRTVSMQGTYTSLGRGARAQYASSFESEARTILDSIDSSASWQLIGERVTPDTFDHFCTFAQDWQEVIANQTEGRRIDRAIRNHRVRFTQILSAPGDALEDVHRLRMAQGSYDCAVSVEEDQDLAGIFEDKIKPHLVALFRDEFDPKKFAIEELSPSFDYTANRVTGTIRFLYQGKESSSNVVELSMSLTVQEEAGNKYTPVHDGGIFSAFVDAGFGLRLRFWRRSCIVVGAETPKERIGAAPKAGPAGLFSKVLDGIPERLDTGSARKVQSEGWNLEQNTSTAFHRFSGAGIDGEEPMQLSGLEEIAMERYVEAPESSSSGGPPTTRRT